MPRNGSGTFSIVNPILVGALRSSAAVNTNFSDLGVTEITNTLPLDGTVGMTGQFKADNGVVTAPGIAFSGDLNVGFRRSAVDEMRWVAGGQDRLYIDADGKAWHLGNMDIAGALVVTGTFTGDADVAALEEMTGNGLARRTGTNTWIQEDGTLEIPFIREGNGTVLPTGVLGDLRIPFACTITGVSLLANASGSCVVDIWKDTFANFPPTVADTITASAKPTLSSATKYEDTTLTGWTTSISADACLRFNLDSISTITRLAIILTAKRFT